MRTRQRICSNDRLTYLLRRSGAFDSRPLETIVPSRDAFFAFLQERWPLFLDRLAGNAGNGPRDASGASDLALERPPDLPFDHDDVRVYIDNLFLEGMLSAVPREAGDALRGEWAAVGIRTDPEADRSRRLAGLMVAVGDTIPGPEARHHEWTAFAYRWAELEVLRLETTASARSETDARIAEIRREPSATPKDWETTPSTAFVKFCPGTTSERLALSSTRSTRSCTAWSWARQACTTKSGSGPAKGSWRAFWIGYWAPGSRST